ncbi:YqgQ family protein [Heyndrickxia ginsengihumi]|uniref:Cytosolic protein n=1 Tax=Heyndrickxia ginsengihumi TaxID=363870 RepID=A0A0A6V9K8_9BACI|nr:YqgQ family protein [Heyndrickxia ginsengihumi]KHD84840.1 cytosolic protein [Heyndrickxia ginsengihumi]MBE6183771.1 DUF910 family protein [Bacillus sp. (in: firmicutes)]MCM3022769.1 YqgQ family protein [Heyndrickxia ginsengihumi]NEY20036.1 DUF910 family protein [Heyndrickxia ginsengihumi]
MRTLYDVQQLLKTFGIIVYIGDRTADLELMELELRELYTAQLIEIKTYQTALLLIRQAKQSIKDKG